MQVLTMARIVQRLSGRGVVKLKIYLLSIILAAGIFNPPSLLSGQAVWASGAVQRPAWTVNSRDYIKVNNIIYEFAPHVSVYRSTRMRSGIYNRVPISRFDLRAGQQVEIKVWKKKCSRLF